ncbi:hypothetical protein F503_01311 [Ophiostoma piceae UAMH 11346]|uniref:Uncharacterized protein n=1 Tax=Ophiostoma piceae (strain UAMH 11346) TaxID=1262450 RepID=S3BUZ2_OPHP1|nr:hypothetical protein F503_01311 [Ophiostoma piceae UAMH 11346]
MPVSLNAVRSALASGAAPSIVNAGPNISSGVPLTNEIAWSTTALIPQPTQVVDNFSSIIAGTPTTFVTVTATPTAAVFVAGFKSTIDGDVEIQDEDLEIIEDGNNDAVDPFDPSNPDVEIVETLHNPEDEDSTPSVTSGNGGAGQVASPIATKVAGAFGPGHVPAHPDEFNVGKGPVAPNYRHRQKNKSEMKKAQKGKSKQAYKKLQDERKAYLAKIQAEAQAAAAAAVGAQ